MKTKRNLMTWAMVSMMWGTAHAGSYRITYADDFTAAQRATLKEAARAAYTQLFANQEVLDCTYRVAKYEPKDEDSVTRLYGAKWLKRGDLFRNQWAVFSRFEQKNERFPDIEFTYYNDEKDFSWGKANYGLVSVGDKNGGVQWKGGFEIGINAAKLDENPNSTRSWAGLLGHEMAHNLSHSHPSAAKVGMDEAYTTDLLINALQACIVSTARPDANAARGKCGGRM